MNRAVWLTFSLLWISVDAICAGRLENRSFRGTDYLAIRADSAQIQLHWKASDGNAIGALAKLAKSLEAEGRKVEMVTNAGIYTPAPAPEGLHVEKSKQLVPLNEKTGNGNFYLLPNGVFYIDQKGKARVLPTTEFAKLKTAPQVATQSGPILLSGGKIHPKFNQGSKSRKLRSGVGVDQDGKVWFVCVDPKKAGNVTNFFNFAEFFRKELKCDQALYLDGTISRMASGEEAKSSRQPTAFAGMFSVSSKEEARD